jgi:dTDP-glucose 4,6-dehydratase
VKKALVTGAGGFIGHHLVAALIREGVEVVCFLRYTSTASRGLLELIPEDEGPDYRTVFGDIRSPETVREAAEGCDTVFHLAAHIGIPYSFETPSDVLSVNLGGTLNVLRTIRETGARLIVTSSSEVYGSAVDVPITEDHRLSAQSPYAASKTAADQLALSFHASYQLPVSICRPFNTYGPGQSQRAVIPSILAQAIYSDRVEIGSLEPSRDFTYVSDMVDGFLAIAGCIETVGRVVQLGTGREVTIGELAELALAAAGRDDVDVVSSSERIRPGTSEVARLVASCELARGLTGWEPVVSLEEGLALTAGWIREHPELYRMRGYAV